MKCNVDFECCFFFLIFIYLFIYFWLCWVFVSVRGLSPVAASGGHPSSRCAGPSPSWPPLLRSTGSRRAGSVVVAHRPSRSAACGILPDQGSNPRPLHWQADSQPLHHRGSPLSVFWVLCWCLCVYRENQYEFAPLCSHKQIAASYTLPWLLWLGAVSPNSQEQTR